jgi:hypothetical protein
MKTETRWGRPGMARMVHAYRDCAHVAATLSLCEGWFRRETTTERPAKDAACRECWHLSQRKETSK